MRLFPADIVMKGVTAEAYFLLFLFFFGTPIFFWGGFPADMILTGVTSYFCPQLLKKLKKARSFCMYVRSGRFEVSVFVCSS